MGLIFEKRHSGSVYLSLTLETDDEHIEIVPSSRTSVSGELGGNVDRDVNTNPIKFVNFYPDIDPRIEHVARNPPHMAADLLAPQVRISVAPFLSSLENPIRRLLRGNVSCTLEVSTSADVFVDAASIQQALFNLAINACDAMPDGGVFEITAVDAEVLAPPPGWGASGGPFVMISCRDTGTGIDANTMERIFEPFFTTKAEGKGSGLGLATVRRAVCDSGGYVQVASARGLGTTVCVFLPVAGGLPQLAGQDGTREQARSILGSRVH